MQNLPTSEGAHRTRANNGTLQHPPNAGNVFTPGPESPVLCVQAKKRMHAGYFDIRHVIKVTALILEF